MSDFISIAKEIGALRLKMRVCEFDQWKLDQDLAARQLEITPSEGWEGKNENDRKVNKEKTFEADPKIARIMAVIEKKRKEVAELTGKLEELEAKRRGMEWEVRGKMADALVICGVNKVNIVNNYSDHPDRAFDDIADALMQASMDNELMPELGDQIDGDPDGEVAKSVFNDGQPYDNTVYDEDYPPPMPETEEEENFDDIPF